VPASPAGYKSTDIKEILRKCACISMLMRRSSGIIGVLGRSESGRTCKGKSALGAALEECGAESMSWAAQKTEPPLAIRKERNAQRLIALLLMIIMITLVTPITSK